MKSILILSAIAGLALAARADLPSDAAFAGTTAAQAFRIKKVEGETDLQAITTIAQFLRDEAQRKGYSGYQLDEFLQLAQQAFRIELDRKVAQADHYPPGLQDCAVQIGRAGVHWFREKKKEGKSDDEAARIIGRFIARESYKEGEIRGYTQDQITECLRIAQEEFLTDIRQVLSEQE